MSTQQLQKSHFKISAQVTYISEQSIPEQSQYFFAYRIKIKNIGPSSAQLVSRHWIISDAFARLEEVRGPGVVGLQPHIKPGQIFEYESACPMSTSTGSMKGYYQFRTESGELFDVEIPEFYLIAPTALH